MTQAQIDLQLEHRTAEIDLTTKCEEVRGHLKKLSAKLQKVESALAFLSKKLTEHTQQINVELSLIPEIVKLIQEDRLKELGNISLSLSLTEQLSEID